MAEPEELDEDLFADLYEGDDAVPAKPVQPPPVMQPEPSEPVKTEPVDESAPSGASNGAHDLDASAMKQEDMGTEGLDAHMGGSGWGGNGNQSYDSVAMDQDDNYGPINVKEDGKMFIGGLNWETTEQSLKDYFSDFGEVSECTVMRDSASGRSRGFGFLTFKDPKCVNIVMVKEHYLDGKIIDPKRAIPREEQERTAKIFVGGVSQEATEEDFKNFFKQFGRVVDATLMMDKDTGRPRGFGFVTFDGEAAVDATLQGPLQILGKPIEVKRAQPRGNMRDGEDDKKFGGRGNKFGGRSDSNAGFDNQQNQNQMQQGGGGGGGGGGNQGMTPAMMAQYWQRMQSYFAQMQQSLAAQQGGGMPNPMGGMGTMAGMGGQMNPAMMQQMMASMNRNPGSPHSGNQMNPAMMQQMQQMQQMQMQQQGGDGGFGGDPALMGGPRPAYTAQEQLAFEQQKYEQQQARRMQQQGGYQGSGGPTSWEGMYDDIPQPSPVPAGPGGGGRGTFGAGRGAPNNARGRQISQPPAGPSNAPANAPTGPKNAGKPGANYRGGGRNSTYRHTPYGGHGRG